MSDIHWVDRPGYLGQFAVDLHRCQRFVLCDPRVHDWTKNLLVYYLSPGGEWIEHFEGERPVADADDENDHWEIQKTYTLEQPQSVTYDFLRFEMGAVPPELEAYRKRVLLHYGPQLGLEYTEESASVASLPAKTRKKKALKTQQNRHVLPAILTAKKRKRSRKPTVEAASADGFPPVAPKPRWDLDTNTLTVGSREWEVFTKDSPNQMKLFDAFEAAGWPLWIPDPFKQNHVLRQTVRDFNKRPNNENDLIRFVKKLSHLSYILQSPERNGTV